MATADYSLPLKVGEVEDENEGHRVPEEGGGQRPEPLLPRGVPHLQLDPLTSPSAVQRGVSHSFLPLERKFKGEFKTFVRT